MPRLNTPTEMEFQEEIVDAFEKYHDSLGFPVMADVLITWFIHTMREQMQGRLTYFQFIKIMTKTWRDVTRLKYQELGEKI